MGNLSIKHSFGEEPPPKKDCAGSSISFHSFTSMHWWFSNLYLQIRHLFLSLISYINCLFNIWICHRHLKTDVKPLFPDVLSQVSSSWINGTSVSWAKKFRSYSSLFTFHICLLLSSNRSVTSVKFTFSVFQICLFISTTTT